MTRGQRLSELGRQQRGQTTVFYALAAMVFICFLAFMVNLGQVLHDRMLLQTAADMVAISGANVQAAGHNEIADLNLEIDKLVEDLQLDIGFPYRVWASQEEAERVIQYYASWIQHTYHVQEQASQNYAQGARSVARQVLDWFSQQYGQGGTTDPQKRPGRAPLSMEELIHPVYPGIQFSDLAQDEVEVWYSYLVPISPPPSAIPVWLWLGGPGYPLGEGRHAMTTVMAPGMVLVGSRTINGISRKDVMKQTYYRVRVSRPEVKPYVNLAGYGFNVGIPAMEAYSLAQPTGGDIHGLSPTYKARLMPLRTQYDYDVEVPHRDKFRH